MVQPYHQGPDQEKVKAPVPIIPDLKAEYNQICKQVKLAVRRAVCRFEALIVRSCKHQPKLLYNYINSQKACHDSIKGLMDSGGTYQTDGRIIANLVNDYFSSVFSVRSAEPIPTLPVRTNVKCVVDMEVFSPDSIKKHIERLNTHKSPGLDCIHPFVVKSCAEVFAQVLSVIYTQSFLSGKIPDKIDSTYICKYINIFNGNQLDQHLDL